MRPAFGADLAGFFPQALLPGPALFVAVDPSVAGFMVGAEVGLTVDAMASTVEVRFGRSIDGPSVPSFDAAAVTGFN